MCQGMVARLDGMEVRLREQIERMAESETLALELDAWIAQMIPRSLVKKGIQVFLPLVGMLDLVGVVLKAREQRHKLQMLLDAIATQQCELQRLLDEVAALRECVQQKE